MNNRLYPEALSIVLGLFLYCTSSFAQTPTQSLTSLSHKEVINLITEQILDQIPEWKKLQKTNETTLQQEIIAWSLPWFEYKRLAAKVLGKHYYTKATKQQRSRFAETLFSSLLHSYSKGFLLFNPQEIKIIDAKIAKNNQFSMVKQQITSDRKTNFLTYQLYKKNDSTHWKIINIIINGINIAKTSQKTFQRAVFEYDNDLDKVIDNWHNIAKKR